VRNLNAAPADLLGPSMDGKRKAHRCLSSAMSFSPLTIWT